MFRFAGALADRVAMVVGAGSSGTGPSIGRASALAYARAGAKVVAVDVTQEAADETAEAISETGGQALALAADGAEEEAVTACVRAATERFGVIDLLHNNVGVMAFGPVSELESREFARVMRVNTLSPFLACKAVLPGMEARRRGAIVNISSIAGIRGTGAPYSAYAASKAAVIGFTRNLALEVADKGIRVNCVLPGFVESAMMRGGLSARFSPEEVEARVAARANSLPMKRLALPEEIASACVFLASDAASYITGATLPVDGGASLDASP